MEKSTSNRWQLPGLLLAFLLCAVSVFSASAKTVDITGTVTSAGDNTGLPGVSITVKGTTSGTVTDLNGKYVINVADQNAVLVFSFIGYEAVEQPVGSRNVIDVVMKEDLKQLSEVVVVGYGTQKKVNLTGAVATVSGDEMIKRPVTNPTAMLQGTMPGVQVTQGRGEPGNEGVSVRIRGSGTFSAAGSEPLVLIDGVQGNMSDLNPNNIESVSVLKDAASASIYGARAANGVILVTTKKGSEGKLSVQYSGNYSPPSCLT